jgi:hypothetical protein
MKRTVTVTGDKAVVREIVALCRRVRSFSFKLPQSMLFFKSCREQALEALGVLAGEDIDLSALKKAEHFDFEIGYIPKKNYKALYDKIFACDGIMIAVAKPCRQRVYLVLVSSKKETDNAKKILSEFGFSSIDKELLGESVGESIEKIKSELDSQSEAVIDGERFILVGEAGMGCAGLCKKLRGIEGINVEVK